MPIPTRRLQFLCHAPLIALVASCGSDNSKSADAGPDAIATGPCSEFDQPSSVVNTYPATYMGNLLGASDDHAVAEGICTDERSYFSQSGEDEVVKLEGLVMGQRYGIVLSSDDDLSFYLVSGCTGPDVEDGECQLFVDQTARREAAEFTAQSDTLFLVIDHFGDDPVESGNYELLVTKAECISVDECSGNTPYCSDFSCVECENSFQCGDPTKPACDQDSKSCVAGWDDCTGDDPSPPEPGDDGPLGAAVVADPSLGNPTIVEQKICSAPLSEVDFFQIDLPANADRVFSVDWTSGADDVDLVLLREDGTLVDSSFRQQPEAIAVDDLPAGKYYIAVTKFESAGNPLRVAIPYTLTVSVPECDTSFDCTTPALPVCGATQLCSTNSSLCTNDDNSEENDGPTNATQLSSGVALDAAICNAPNTEADYYRITVGDGDALDVLVTFDTANAADLDIQVFNANGKSQGFSLWSAPEKVNLTFLPAGTYFIEVLFFSTASVVNAHPYSILATATPSAGCQNNSECDDEFTTQNFRGSCNPGTGACSDIVGNGTAATNIPCDSNTDCASGRCSVLQFQENAGTSVCTIACNSDSECTTAHGAGFSCTVPFATNFCHPNCTAGSLECGVNQQSSELDSGQPWDYLVCNAGVCELDN